MLRQFFKTITIYRSESIDENKDNAAYEIYNYGKKLWEKMRNLQYNCHRTLIIEIRIAIKFISFVKKILPGFYVAFLKFIKEYS